jgi:threonyl-tRNA synthetase
MLGLPWKRIINVCCVVLRVWAYIFGGDGSLTLTVDHKAGKKADAHGRDKQRANKESGDRITSSEGSGLIGGPFQVTPSPAYLNDRNAIFERLWAAEQEKVAAKEEISINITLPSGEVKTGFAFKTSPLDIAKGISQGLADNVVIAKVLFSSRHDTGDVIVACDEDEEALASKEDHSQSGGEGELWDLNRPLVGDCLLKLLKFDEPEAKTVRPHTGAA